MAKSNDTIDCGDTVVVVSPSGFKHLKYRVWQKRLMIDGSFIYRLSGDGLFDGCYCSLFELKKVKG